MFFVASDRVQLLLQVKAIAELGRLEQEFQKTEQVAMECLRLENT